MTDNTQAEALAALIERFRGLHIDHEPDGWPAVRTREITALLGRIAELEAQLEAIGAGGVSALMGAAKAGSEPVAWQYRSVRDKGLWFDCTEGRAQQRAAHPDKWDVRYLYTHPSPPEGMAGWQPIETAPKDGTPLLLRSKKGRIADGAWITATSSCGGWTWAYVNLEPIEWQPLPVALSMDGESNG